MTIRGRLGPDKHDDKIIRILNKCITWTKDGIQYESDPRHAELLLRELGIPIDGKRSITTPGSTTEEDEKDAKLDPQKAYRYRSILAKANFLSQDRADISFATKELCRDFFCTDLAFLENDEACGKIFGEIPKAGLQICLAICT